MDEQSILKILNVLFLKCNCHNNFIKLLSLSKSKLLLVFIFCNFNICNAQSNSLTQSTLKGIMSIETKTYNATEKFGEVEKVTLSYVQVEKFNEYGDLIERVIHDSDANDGLIHANSTVVLIYNDNRKIKEVNEYSSDGNLIDKIIYKYDEYGKIKQENDYYSDGSIQTKKTYKYDALGKLLGWGTEYHYPKGNSPERTYKQEHIIGERDETDVKYYVKGNMVEIQYNKFQKTTSKYDSRGNLLEVVAIDNWVEYEEGYDSLGVKNKPKYYGHTIKSSFKYDDKNNLIEYKVPAGKLTYKYNFDKNGNWIKRIQFNDDEPDEISERLIVYY